MEAILAAVVVSLIALVGITTITLKQDLINTLSFALVSLAAGTFLGDSFFHLLPESLQIALDKNIPQTDILFFPLLGIILFFVLEEIIHWHHHYEINECERTEEHHQENNKINPIAITNLVGDGLHNFLDGLAIAASFAISAEAGVATTMAIILHEIPQEFADFGILIESGLTRTKALLWNFASGLISVFGVIVFLTFSSFAKNIEVYLLAFIAGTFIYIASTDLFPHIHNRSKRLKDLLQVLLIILGIMIMYLLSVIE